MTTITLTCSCGDRHTVTATWMRGYTSTMQEQQSFLYQHRMCQSPRRWSDVFDVIGNAVPPVLMRQIGASL